jgi:hypothetical protein
LASLDAQEAAQPLLKKLGLHNHMLFAGTSVVQVWQACGREAKQSSQRTPSHTSTKVLHTHTFRSIPRITGIWANKRGVRHVSI